MSVKSTGIKDIEGNEIFEDDALIRCYPRSFSYLDKNLQKRTSKQNIYQYKIVKWIITRSYAGWNLGYPNKWKRLGNINDITDQKLLERFILKS